MLTIILASAENGATVQQVGPGPCKAWHHSEVTFSCIHLMAQMKRTTPPMNHSQRNKNAWKRRSEYDESQATPSPRPMWCIFAALHIIAALPVVNTNNWPAHCHIGGSLQQHLRAWQAVLSHAAPYSRCLPSNTISLSQFARAKFLFHLDLVP
uniref:Uncharacterized protein n=1 Tax=Eutreptiella gymnastica TaxID=73025 RepID=A0A7S4D3L9_9EUGL